MLVLVRHGQSAGNAAGLLLGHADSPLTDLGRRQAGATAAYLAGSLVPPVARIVTSPLGRARETARTLAEAWASSFGGAPTVEVDERLIELDYGGLDESKVSEVPAELWSAWRSDPGWRPPGGETLEEMAERVVPACVELGSEAVAAHVLAVSHVSPIKAAVAWALGTGIATSWRMSLGVSSVSRISVTAGTPALVSFNETAHLAGL